MPKESFMLVSLKEDKAKKLAQVIGSPTCTKILDYLANKEATETQMSKDLGIPLSTVHYNLQQLVQAKLVIVEEFHYSEKGREVNHYKLANKYIIIAPKDDPSFMERLKHFVPVTLLTLGVAAVLKVMQLFTGTAAPAAERTMLAAAPMAADVAPMAADAAVQESAGVMATGASEALVQTADAAVGAAAPAMKASAAGAVEGSARGMMLDTGIENATQNITDQTAIAYATGSPSPPVETLIPPPDQVVPPGVPWWQSPMVDWFLIGAFTLLILLILWEWIRYLREKRQ